MRKNWIENLNYRLELCKNNNEKLLEIILYLCFQEKISPFVIEKSDRALYMNYLREQSTDIIFERVRELQAFEERRMKQF